MLKYNLFDYMWSLLNWRGYSNWVGGSYLIIILAISNCVPAFKKVMCPHFFFFFQILSKAFNGSKLFYFPFLRHYSKSSADESSTSSKGFLSWKWLSGMKQSFSSKFCFCLFLIETSCHCLFCHGIRALGCGQCPVLSHLGKEAQAKAIWKKILEI